MANWIKIITDDEETLIDLAQVDSATKMANGKIRLWMKSGRYADAPFLEDLWAKLEINAQIERPKPPAPAPDPVEEGKRSTPSKDLGEDKCLELGNLFSLIWYEGWRHEMALLVASWLAHQGVCLENAKSIVRIASDKQRGDTVKRVADVEDTYAKYIEGGSVKGRPTLELMIDESFPNAAKDKAKTILGKIEKILPKKKITLVNQR